ncbi:MAG: ribulokinase [Candidatus Aminicenantes bacterium]|nr:ribulokinase [Candidatus Aminicenantes bacterium]
MRIQTKKYSLGLDFGTNSCRALIVDISDGRELATSVFPYPSGSDGVFIDKKEPNIARQHPKDYLIGMEKCVKTALKKAQKNEPEFDPEQVIGIGVDTTGSSPMPINAKGIPLCFLPEFEQDLNAMVWLWKDHSSHQEAKEITEIAREMRPQYLEKIGGVYSSEWFWSKVFHCKNAAPNVFESAHSWVEICDYLPAVLTGETRPGHLKRSICAAGHKAMYCEEWDGLPDKEFLRKLDPEMAKLKDRLYDRAQASDKPAGYLCLEWAEKLGLKKGIAVAVGAFDAHMGGVGAGVKEQTLVKILGTSTCDILIHSKEKGPLNIPGVCGIVDSSVIPGYYGIEAGQSAVGDIFLWFVEKLTPEKYGKTAPEKFKNLEKEASKQRPGEHGLVALDWNNGNRTILVDVRLSGLLVGQTLHTEPHEIYRALIEATAFGALTIINRIQKYDVSIKDIINCGGLAARNPFLMQIYADILGRPMKVSRSDQSPALGAALFGAVAAGKNTSGYLNVEQAQKKMTGIKKIFHPDPDNHKVYQELYQFYRKLHHAFGTLNWTGSLFDVMKDLIDLREIQRKEIHA